MILTHSVTRPSSQPQACRELLCNGSTLSLLPPPTVVASNLIRCPETSYASELAVFTALLVTLVTPPCSASSSCGFRATNDRRGLSQKEQMVYVLNDRLRRVGGQTSRLIYTY